MSSNSNELLARLGAGESIGMVCESAGMSRAEFDKWWDEETRRRVPDPGGAIEAGVSGDARITRNRWGVPHISASNDTDLFFAFGFAMAQDRLFQLDYLRRKGHGRLSEVLGEDGLQLDIVARTVGLNRIARAEWETLPDETRSLLNSFSDGVNAFMEKSRDCLPVEFALLDYKPEPWSPVDCLAIATEFRYYLTVRFPVIVGPELAKRALGNDELFEAFLTGEAEDESILPAGSYAPVQGGLMPVGDVIGDPDEGLGSNNWVVSGARTESGKPMVASDPHIAFAAVSCWYEVQLSGGSFDVTGMAFAGMPAIMFGRNRRIGWAITNNICAQRDLYQERTDPENPGAFLFDGKWEPERKLVETIHVRGGKTVEKTIRFSRNGPIVDELLQAEADGTGPVSLKWLGATECGWLTSLLGVDRADSVEEFREAIRPWRVPTWSMMAADVDGHFGYQAVGGIPVRKMRHLGYRPGWDPEHQWKGLIPHEHMPRLVDPERGWAASANNRTAPDDFPYPLAGAWSSGHRARRIRQMIEERDTFNKDAFGQMHQDTRALRADEAMPALSLILGGNDDPRIREALRRLEEWDHRMDPESVGASIFEVFFNRWSRRVSEERFDGALATALEGNCGGIAASLLHSDAANWFARNDREQAIVDAMSSALDEIEGRLGPDMDTWKWGTLHKIHLRHVLTDRGDLGELLDRGGLPVGGNGVTVCNTGFDPNWGALMGANYRLISDLGQDGMWAVESQGQSGHPGSEHYCDQLPEWLAGRYHFLPFGDVRSSEDSESVLTLVP